jgi:hypothetical protein
MTIRLRAFASISFGLLIWLAAAPAAQAQLCSANSQCGSGQSCQPFLLGLRTCQFARCNADSECPSDRLCVNGLCQTVPCASDRPCRGGACRQGICRSPVPPTNGGRSGGATTPPRTGALCGKQTVNGAPHVYPMCPNSQKCVQGHCQVLQQ